jgi:DNA-binding NarL/FixJ family response regulator
MRVSLQALLAAMPELEKIELADDDATALELVAEGGPAVVLLDTNLPGDDGVWAVLEQIKAQWPQVQCLVMADNNRQKQAAQDAGADEVLVKGFPTLELFVAVERLLLQKEVKNGVPNEEF